MHVKRGMNKCLFDRTRRMTTTEEGLREEEKHLEQVLLNNGYPLTLINKSSQSTIGDEDIMEADGEGEEKQPVVCIPYVAGLSEDISRVGRRFGIRTIFIVPTLQSHLVRVKDKVPTSVQSNMVYRVPCSLGEKYTSGRQ